MITLTNVGTAYDTIAAARGLGIARIDFRGATSITFDVLHQKVGTGTVSYQLWVFDLDGSGNEINGAELGVVTDSGGAGVRYLTGNFNVAINGDKLVRVRAKSTVAGDDPIFLGCSVSLNYP